MKRFLMTALATAVAAGAFAQSGTVAPRDAGTEETISVSGTGRVTLVPDRFSFTATVMTLAPTVEEAVSSNNTKVAAVVSALKAQGAKPDEIQTANFSIFPQQDYRQQEQGQLPRVIGYQVSNTVTVTRKQIADAGKLLQAAIAAGVNQTSGLSFSVSDPARGRDQGLQLAFADARAKASLLAQAAGRTLGRAMIITEGGAVAPPPPRPMTRVMATAAPAMVESTVPVESGSEELTYTVSVVFAMNR